MSTSPPVPVKRRWLGVLLSLCVPGLGVLRAGLPWRAAGWFFGLLISVLIVGLCFGLSIVPVPVAVAVLAAAIIAQIWMLCDSWRPGHMTWLLWVIFAGLFAAVLLIPHPVLLVARAFKMPAGAMEPTLLGSRYAATPDHVIADGLSYRFSSPRRGDLIVFATSLIPDIQSSSTGTEKEVFFIKRLVGLPGERIRIDQGRVYTDGRLLANEDGIPSSLVYTEASSLVSSSAKRDGDTFVVGPDEYFVLGDNSANSFDSRYWGGVPVSAIYGKVTMIYYPFSRAGRVASTTSKPNTTVADNRLPAPSRNGSFNYHP